MFSWFTRHVAYFFFDDGSLQAFKREREQDYLHFRTTANFSQRLLCPLTLLEFSSLDIPLFGFSSL